jgi:hypothetical protein
MGKAGKEEMHPEGTVTVSLERGKREVSGSLPLTLDEVELGTAVITVELTGYMTERIPVGEPIAEWYLNNPLYNGINGFAVIDLHGEKRAVSEGQLDIGSATAYGKEGAEKTLLVVRYGETDTELRTTLIELTPDE